MYTQSNSWQGYTVFVQNVIRRFGVGTLTAVLGLFCVLFSVTFYMVAAHLFVGSIRGFAVFVSLVIPAIVAPPVCMVLLKLARSLDRAKQDLQHTSERLRVLSHRLLEVQEGERRHVALELHDEIGQTLTGLRIGLTQAEDSGTLESALSILHGNTPAVEDLINRVRNLSIELRPPILDDFGLSAALDWYVNRLSARAGFKVMLHMDFTDERLPPVLELTCFRITQEALTNVARHSSAKTVYIDLEKIDGDLHLTVRDDGKGFDGGATRMGELRSESFGLLGMQERASLAGGKMEFVSEPGKGCVIHAQFPLDRGTGDRVRALGNDWARRW